MITQYDLVAQCNLYLKSQNRSLELPTGQCNGLASLWLYYTAVGMEFRYTELIDAAMELDDGDFEENKTIEMLISQMVFLQATNPNILTPRQQNNLDISINGLLKDEYISSKLQAVEFQFSHNLTKSECVDLFEKVVKRKKLILIGISYHTMALFYDGKKYHFYDSNESIYIAFSSSSLEGIVDKLYSTYLSRDSATKRLGIGIDIFSLERHTPAQYPTASYFIEYYKRSGTNLFSLDDHKDSPLDLMLSFRHYDLIVKNLVFISAEQTTYLKVFLHAMENDNTDAQQALLRNGFNPDTPDEYGDTALHKAVKRGEINTVELLLKSEANPRINNREKLNALMLAIQYGSLAIVRLLYQDPHQWFSSLTATQNNLHTPLGYAVHYNDVELVRYFLEHGADPNEQDAYGYSALHQAAYVGAAAAAELLLLYRADPKLKTRRSKKSAFDLAREKKHSLVYSLLSEKDKSSQPRPCGLFFSIKPETDEVILVPPPEISP